MLAQHGFTKIILLVGILMGIGIISYFFLNQSTPKLIDPDTQDPLSIPLPSTFIPTSTPFLDKTIRQLPFKLTDGWDSYSSDTGYKIQIPASFNKDIQPEQWQSGSCVMNFQDKIRKETIIAKLVPYSQTAKKDLIETSSDLKYSYEDAYIVKRQGLIVQASPVTLPGGGSYGVIPDGKYALILGWSQRNSTNPDFTNLLQSVQIEGLLDVSRCDKTFEEPKITGSISNITYDCISGGGKSCDVYISDKKIQAQVDNLTQSSPALGARGTIEGIDLDPQNKTRWIGKNIEVYAKMLDPKNYTIYGDSKYYIKVTR